ncbi:PLP-dependent transferase [Acephala macrosclerotiorum]|nr:PLP-dependent transferase [Acephala macrosclerotiorum]
MSIILFFTGGSLLGFDMGFAMNKSSEGTDIGIKIARNRNTMSKGSRRIKSSSLHAWGTTMARFWAHFLPQTMKRSRQISDRVFQLLVPTSQDEPSASTISKTWKILFKERGHRICALIVECVQGYAGCLPADEGYIEAVFDLCKKHNILFIADKIQSGFGRAGYLMAYLMAYLMEGIFLGMWILGEGVDR